MSSAGASDVVVAALSRVLGVDGALLRQDTPLAPLGWDSLARICLADALADAGWMYDNLARVRTVGDLVDGCVSGAAS